MCPSGGGCQMFSHVVLLIWLIPTTISVLGYISSTDNGSEKAGVSR